MGKVHAHYGLFLSTKMPDSTVSFYIILSEFHAYDCITYPIALGSQ